MSVVPRYVADRPAFGRGTSGCTMGEWVWACVCRGVAFRALHPPPSATHTLTPPPPYACLPQAAAEITWPKDAAVSVDLGLQRRAAARAAPKTFRETEVR